VTTLTDYIKMIHKNSQKRYHNPSYIYFITVNTKDKQSFFREKIWCNLWIEELQILKKLKPFKLFGFCLNHDHFHMLLQCNEKHNISQVMQSFKKNFSQDANKIIQDLPAGANSDSRLQKVNLDDFREKYKNASTQKKFYWQKSFHDRVIRNELELENFREYILNNPINWAMDRENISKV